MKSLRTATFWHFNLPYLHPSLSSSIVTLETAKQSFHFNLPYLHPSLSSSIVTLESKAKLAHSYSLILSPKFPFSFTNQHTEQQSIKICDAKTELHGEVMDPLLQWETSLCLLPGMDRASRQKTSKDIVEHYTVDIYRLLLQ
jgi:hypothetical protein